MPSQCVLAKIVALRDTRYLLPFSLVLSLCFAALSTMTSPVAHPYTGGSPCNAREGTPYALVHLVVELPGLLLIHLLTLPVLGDRLELELPAINKCTDTYARRTT